MENNIGLYIHIPFCTGKCPYCDFYSINYSNAEMHRYVENVVQKIHYYSSIYKCKADTLYIGGGTPSLCKTENLIKIIDAAKTAFLTKDYEATIEVNPTSSELLDFRALHDAGFNRISVGLQSANDNELKTLGRRHTSEDAAYTVEKAHSGGFDNISMDIMLAVLGQTYSSLKRSIDFCADCGADHISAYILKIEDGTPFADMYDELDFYDDDVQADFYKAACSYLKMLGFEQYEISNFCKNGKTGKHNLKYWNCDEYLGIGSAAHSFMHGKRFYYPRDINGFYLNTVIDDGTGGDMLEYAMLRLRLADGLKLNAFYNKYGRSFPIEKCIDKLDSFSKAGLVTFDSEHIALTTEGFLVSNRIISDVLYDIG